MPPLPISRIVLVLVTAISTLAACSSHAPPAAVADTSGQATPAPIAHAEQLTPAVVPTRFVLENTEEHEIVSSSLGRTYRIFVSLPSDYRENEAHRYPVLFITDTTYAFPLVRNIGRMVGDKGNGLEEFILIGLSYASGDTSQYSRRRDYTPTPRGPRSAITSDMPGLPVLHGEAEAYRLFLRDEVFPVVASNYRADMDRKVFAGHSYGGLLGAHMLLTEPSMFQKYILSSASLWWDRRFMFQREQDYAGQHKDLPADVFLSIGSYETLNPASDDPRYMTEVDMLRDMQRFEKRLKSRGYRSLRVESTVIAEEDHLSVYPAAIGRGLRWAFPPVKRS